MTKSCVLIWLLLVLAISGCTNGLLVSPQIPTGGINSRSPDEYPSYSGDGRYLAFASDRRGHRDIFLYDNQRRTLVALPNLNHRNSSQDQPALSNKGRYIAYISTERGKTDIFVYDRNSQRSQLLSANIRGSVRYPTITGDGSSIAFQTSQLGQWNIAIVERNISPE
ncbi:MAG: biopolymer transporter [Spirulinaceae cyanobacterium]